MKSRILFFKLFLCFLFIYCTKSFSQQDWTKLYVELEKAIAENYNQPPLSENNPTVWYNWIDRKGEDRNRVAEVLDQLNKLSVEYPDNEEYNKLTSQYYELLKYAEKSGKRTVDGASDKFLYITDEDYWERTYKRIHSFGREIYLRAQRNKFDTYLPKKKSRCLMRFSIGSLESSAYGAGLYKDRDLRFGSLDDEGSMNIPDREHDVRCERRGEFERLSEGTPLRTIELAIKQVDMLRDECDWWNFSDERGDATDLLNEYYEDALCKIPPHKQKEGHKHLRDLIADTDGTEKSVEYNKGFYGTLYGKVEIKESGDIKAAPGAAVRVDDYEESWTVVADKNGNYEIKNVILHKDCSPFKISAVYQGDRVDDEYEGNLEQPEKNYRQKKDLLIISDKQYTWYGQLTVNYFELTNCEFDTSYKNGSSHYSDKGEKRQRADLTITANDDSDFRAVTTFIFDDMNLTGNIFGKYYTETTSQGSSDDHRSFSHQMFLGYGTYAAEQNELTIQIVSEALTDMAPIEEMIQDIVSSGYNEEVIDDKTRQIDELMDGGNKKSFPVKVNIQLPNVRYANCKYSDYRESTSKERGTVVEVDQKGFKDAPITIPLQITLDGTYYKGEDGNDRIVASYNKTDTADHIQEKCPPIQKSLSANFTMHKRIIKK